MTPTVQETTRNMALIFAHPAGFRFIAPATGSGNYSLTTTVDYEEPLPDDQNDLAGRVMGALAGLARLSRADYGNQRSVDGTMALHDSEGASDNRPITCTTLESLALQLDPMGLTPSVEDLRHVVCCLAGSSIVTDLSSPPSAGHSSQRRFVTFVYFSLSRSDEILGSTLQYSFSSPVWRLADLHAEA